MFKGMWKDIMWKNIITAFKWVLIAFNMVLGYFIPTIFCFIFLLFINRPKGFSYYVPESEHSFNIFLGMVIFIVWTIIEFVVNRPIIHAEEKAKKVSLFTILLFTILGAIIYFIINGFKILYF